MNDKAYLQNHLQRVISVNKIVSLFYCDLEKGFSTPGEKHHFWEFVYVDQGELYVETQSGSFVLRKGEIYFHMPDEFHCHACHSKQATSICIGSFMGDNPLYGYLHQAKILLHSQLQHLLAQLLAYCGTVFSSIVDNSQTLYLVKKDGYPTYYEHLLINYLEIFLLEMIRESQQQLSEVSNNALNQSSLSQNRNRQLVQSAKNYLQERVESRIHLPHLCQYLSCSKSTLSKAFKEATNLTVIEYFNRLKIEKAKDMLRSTHLNITQISEALHFSSIYYFSTLFKKETGMFPTAYAKSIKVYHCTHFLSMDSRDREKTPLQWVLTEGVRREEEQEMTL